MTFKIRTYFHLYADGSWEIPTKDFIEAMCQSKLIYFPITIGVVGTEDNVNNAVMKLNKEMLPKSARVRFVTSSDKKYEQFTQMLMWHDAKIDPGHMLYAHTKGSYNLNEINPYWRRSMIRHNILNWPYCISLLEKEYDAVGCHLLYTGGRPFFAGTFFWANADYIQNLNPPESTNRYEAEYWILQDNPKAYDLLPGFPTIGLFENDTTWEK